MRTPSHTVSVGIMSAPAITVDFHGAWTATDGTTLCDRRLTLDRPTGFRPASPDCTFTLHDVTIGKDYHWQRHENQTFGGSLDIIVENDRLTAVNTIDIEQYLTSVISSEMSPNAGIEFLKATAVISRSWAIRQQLSGKGTHATPSVPDFPAPGDREFITWHDHQDHTLYDLCADDHCQRYQGIERISNPLAERAVRETAGLVLTHRGEVCDCRFSKCCGGMTENFETCWQDTPVDYLRAHPDTDPDCKTDFCNTTDKAILSQVLNNYDLETTDFYRWTRVYTQSRLQDLLRRKLRRDFGQIRQLRPLSRGRSGRISRLLISGTHSSLIIGKELTIRAALSESHLYSSAFTIETTPSATPGIPATFTLHGRGWGHGVGLCQIGAAVMAARGYDFRRILAHYYSGTTLSQANSNVVNL